MLDAPRQDWSAYDEAVRESDAEWIRNQTPQDRFALYCDLIRIIRESRDPNANWDALERWRWEQKLEARQREIEAYRQLDEYRARTAERDAD